MMSGKTPSPVYQVTELFKEFLAIGESRHEAKQELFRRGGTVQSMGNKIHSWGSFKRESQAAIGFAKWCKAQYGMKYLSEIQPGWTKVYIELRQQQVKHNTVVADLTGIRRLDKCLQHKGWVTGSIVPSDVKLSRVDSPRGAYTRGEVRQIIAYVDKRNPLAADVLRVQFSGGLRLREAITVRSDCLDLRRGLMQTIGKGGKARTVELLDKRVLARLDLRERFPLRPGPGGNGLKLTEGSWIRRIQQLIRSACRTLNIQPRGSHAIRACAARTYYQSLVVQNWSKQTALAMIAEWLGHGPHRLDVLKKYLGEELIADALQSD